MPDNSITFNSVVLPCSVEHFPKITHARRKYTKYSVPGRSGDIIVPQDAFENVMVSYDIYAGAGTDGSAVSSFADLARILCQPDYCRLQDTYDPLHYRDAFYAGQLDAENSWNRFGRATIEFDCKPQRWLLSGDVFLRPNLGDTITNPTAFTSKPLLFVRMTGAEKSGTITLNGATLTLTGLAGTSCYIDCETQDCYSGATNKNRYLSGTFPVLDPGDCILTYDGDVDEVMIKPRWWEL